MARTGAAPRGPRQGAIERELDGEALDVADLGEMLAQLGARPGVRHEELDGVVQAPDVGHRGAGREQRRRIRRAPGAVRVTSIWAGASVGAAVDGADELEVRLRGLSRTSVSPSS